jgi:cell division protein FtsW (lipid II flippase)
MAIRVVEFSNGDTKLERFLHKNQYTQRKLLNFKNWINGGLRSFQKSEFKKSIIFIFSDKKYLKLKSWLNLNAIIFFLLIRLKIYVNFQKKKSQ